MHILRVYYKGDPNIIFDYLFYHTQHHAKPPLMDSMQVLEDRQRAL